MSDNESEVSALSAKRSPLIFISHDSRDALIAEAFAKLLSSVSAGVLKSFRSSDKKGRQGIEYGVEWYPQIMKKLEESSDVVCLLTPSSVGRPWILYEAGVAKGKLDTPVHGIALGIPLQNATTGPFAQFQNSDDSEEALTQLVVQLVSRIPGAEPDRDVVRSRVDAFRTEVFPLLAAEPADKGEEEEADEDSVAQLFEEVKVMFQNLPSRIERRFDPEYGISKRKRIPDRLIYEITNNFGKEFPDGVAVLIAASQFREDFPWIYELAVVAYRSIASGEGEALNALEQLKYVSHATLDHPIMREMAFRSKSRFFDPELMIDGLNRAISVARDRLMQHRSSNGASSSWTADRIDLLRKLWENGIGASEIASVLGGVGRNAVIGKAHRLGLQSRPTSATTDNSAE